MKENINKLDIKLTRSIDSNVFGYINWDFEHEEEKEVFLKYAKELKIYLKAYLKKESKNNLNTIINSYSKGCINDLINYLQDNKDKILSQRAFVGSFELNKLIDIIKQSSIQEIYDLRSGFHIVYSFENLKEYYSDDKEAISWLREALEEYLISIQDIQKNRSVAVQYFIKDLNDIEVKLS